MNAPLIVFLCVTFVFGVVAHRLARTMLTGPIVFVAAGMVAAWTLPASDRLDFELDAVLWPAKVALALVLFTDATHVRVRGLFRGLGLPTRLLGIGMPLVIVFGTLLAVVVSDRLSLAEAAILATILAPTDAGLGQAIMSSPRVPGGVRQALNVEAGVNDGFAVPCLVLFIGLARRDGGDGPRSFLVFVLEQIGYGVMTGVVVGLIGGLLLREAKSRRWMTATSYQLALVALALLSFVVAIELGGNEFVSPFVAGLLVKLRFEEAGSQMDGFSEVWGQSLNYLVLFVFGMVALSELGSLDASAWLYALASLTVVRGSAVAISMIGAATRPESVLFMAWFGPRGLASIVLGLILVREDAVIAGQADIEQAVIATVLLSVIMHGATTAPGISWYATRVRNLPRTLPSGFTPFGNRCTPGAVIADAHAASLDPFLSAAASRASDGRLPNSRRNW